MSAGFPFLLQSFFTDRLFRQRRASPHTIASYRDSFRLLLRFANQRLGKAPSTLTLDDLTIPFIGDFLDSLETGRKNSARLAISAWPPSIPFFATSLWKNPAMPCFASASCRYPPNVTNADLSNFSIAKRSMRWWTLPIPPIGSDAVIGPCFYSQCRPDSGSPSWSVCVVRISSWEPAPTCTAWEKAGKSGARLCAQKQQECWTHGCANDTAILRIRCLLVSEVGSSAATQSSVSSENMRLLQHEPAHHTKERKSVPMCCDTQQQWTFSNMVSTAP